MASSSFSPMARIIFTTRSPAKIRIKSSSSDKKKRDSPGSPWRPARPRNWLSIRRDSWRSEPMICKPPASSTCWFRTCHSAWACSFISGVTLSILASSACQLPPKIISVPRPAMLVAIVTALGLPACAIISASRSCCLALRTLCWMPSCVSNSESTSLASMVAVPTKIGACFSWIRLISRMMPWYLPILLRKIWSSRSIRWIGLWVGIITTSKS